MNDSFSQHPAERRMRACAAFVRIPFRPVPIVRNGHVVGERLRTDNRLAMTALKALDRRAARSRARDPVAVLERYLDWLDRRATRLVEK